MNVTQAATPARPEVSVIITTYNRAYVLRRAVDSILAQDLENLELIVVDNGSTDNTQELLGGIRDPRLVRLRLDVNRGIAPGYNAGIDRARGEWFTVLASDDEARPEGLSTMLRVPREIDPKIDAVTCNCVDSVTGQFSGLGLDHDQWLGFGTIAAKCVGQFWGLERRSLTTGLRFNEKLRLPDGVYYYKINQRAKRYYIHKPLYIYHTEGHDRLSTPARMKLDAWLHAFSEHYKALEEESEYLDILRRFNRRDYANNMRLIFLVHVLEGRRESATRAYLAGKKFWPVRRRLPLLAALAAGQAGARLLVRFAMACR